MSVFIPRKINVGFQKRDGTYTGKLAYVVYTDEKGVVRKKASWENWRHKNIEPVEYDNEPKEGFVLNKQAGGRANSWSSWNIRRTTVRIYDPRDFEFEVGIDNLLYILENTSSIKGKGLEGEFVYGWQGSELVLISTSAPEYSEYIKSRDAIYDKGTVKIADLILGATYKDRKGDQFVYLCRAPAYAEEYRQEYMGSVESQGKQFFLYELGNGYKSFIKRKTLTFVDVVDPNPREDYAKLMEQLEHQPIYSPIDVTKTKYVPFKLKEFEKVADNGYGSFYSQGVTYRIERQYGTKPVESPQVVIAGQRLPSYAGTRTQVDYTRRVWTAFPQNSYGRGYPQYDMVEEMFNSYQPQHRDKYLKNGKFYRRDF